MDVTLQKAPLMSPSDTPDESKVSPLTAPYRKDFSLSSGAKFLGIAKTTLKRAIERGDVKATQNAAGHYTIEGAQIFQYQQNLEADRLREKASQDVTSGETGSAPRSAPSHAPPLDAGHQRGSAPRGAPPFAPVSSDAPVTPSHFEEIKVLKAENEGLKARIEVTERMYTDYKTMTEEAFKRLPAPMQPDIAESVSEPKATHSKFPLTAVSVLLVIAAGAAAVYLYPDQLRELLSGQGTPIVDSAALQQAPDVVVTSPSTVNPPR